MDAAIEIRGLRKAWRGFALEDVSFDVPRGEVCGLIGPNGAGKTTTIRLVMNLLRRDAGEIRVFGFDNVRREVEIKRRIGFVYDAPRFPEDVRLGAIAAALRPFYPGWDERRFRGLLNEFGLSARATPKRLSHGARMKFSLALALCHDADLVLMDEPTAGLDPAFRFELLDRLRGIVQDERKTVVFSSHLTADLERIADRIVFLRGGRVVFAAPRDAILEVWGLVKSAGGAVRPADVPGLRGWRRTACAFEALTCDLAAARRALGAAAVYDKAGLEDIMYFAGREETDA